MPAQSFSTDLWHRDLSDLPTADREAATDILIFASLELSCHPYHRASKPMAASDRQTIFKNPATGHACLVLSVVPKEEDPSPYRLRVDFFDKAEDIVASFASVHRAPNTQFSEKGERRFFVARNTPRKELRALIQQIVALAR
jgi:hypothetical protein